jgi:predicted MFS family arabinose efflux permease
MATNASRIELNQAKAGSLSKSLIFLMAISAGMAVANLYYSQPLLADIGHSFNVGANRVGTISMCTQIGYAVGMFLFVPLGDMKERRNLICILLLAVTLSLVGVATAQNLLWLDIASFAVGLTTVVPQILVPLAAQLAPPAERGKVIGNVMSGLLIGILLARTVSGFIGGILGWRNMYWIAAVLMFALANILRYLLPTSYPQTKLNYRQLMKSIGQLIMEHRTLREASLIGAMMFGGFSVFWTSLAFYIEGPPYYYGSGVAGLFGLVGVVGATSASLVGRLADRVSPKSIVGMAIGITLLSYVLFGFFGEHLWGLIVGVILFDLGMQGTQISNQTRIYTLVPEARNRLNTVFMVSTFLGGAVGSSVGSYAWSLFGWIGVCLVGGFMIFIGLAVWATHRFRRTS